MGGIEVLAAIVLASSLLGELLGVGFIPISIVNSTTRTTMQIDYWHTRLQATFFIVDIMNI